MVRTTMGICETNQADQAKFQFVVERQGQQRASDLPISADDLKRLALQASLRNMGITELMGQALAKAIQKNMIQDILD